MFIRFFIICFYSILIASGCVHASDTVKDASQCNIDLNHDGLLDTAVNISHGESYELVVLLKTVSAYDVHTLRISKSKMILSCVNGDSVESTAAGEGKVNKFSTGGTYLRLTQPEGASIVYFLDGKDFKEVWTAD